MSDPIADFYSGPTRQQGGGSRRLITPMSSAGKAAIPVFRGIKERTTELSKEPQVKAVVKQGRDGKQFGIERLKEKNTDNFKEDLKKVERLKWLSRRKKDKGKQMYQYRQTVPEASPKVSGKQYKRSRIGALLGNDTY